MDEKIWYLIVGGEKEGPYSVAELKEHPFASPGALVWREGFTNPLPIKAVRELAALFEEEVLYVEEGDGSDLLPPDEEAVLHLERGPPPLFFWIAIALLVLFYFFYLVLTS